MTIQYTMYTIMSNTDALRTAIQEGLTELVKVLLSSGVIPSEDSLYTACSYGRADIVQLLLPRGLNYRSESGQSPLHTACKAGKSAIGNAIDDQRSDYDATVTILVTQAPQLINELDNWNSTSLMVALSRENFTLAKILLNHGADITNRDNHGFTALLIAVNHECEPSLIKHLIQAGADLDFIRFCNIPYVVICRS
jgi:ankyrin repeat protein